MTFIPREDEITPEWLGEQLRNAGHDGVRVTGYTAQRIGTGQIGKCIRYTLQLEGADKNTPRSLVAKLASDDALSQATGVALRNYLKEVSFYQTLQKRLTIRTPKCYFAEIEGEGPHFALLLEDMAPATQGDQLAGCAPGVAAAAVNELVGLHAPTWCDDSLLGLDWLGERSEESAEVTRTLYQTNLPAFMDRFGSKLEADERDIIEKVGSAQGGLFAPLGDTFSVVHVDYRLDNMLIDERTAPPTITVVDWQSLTLGRPLSDVAYFMGAGLQPGDRRPVEEDIVRGYHQRLDAAGITGYDWAQCWHDYRLGTFAGFGVTVIAATIVVQTERGDEMFTAMARRHARHALDLGASEFLH